MCAVTTIRVDRSHWLDIVADYEGKKVSAMMYRPTCPKLTVYSSPFRPNCSNDVTTDALSNAINNIEPYEEWIRLTRSKNRRRRARH